MLHQPSTQNPPSNPLSSAQASGHCRRKHYNHVCDTKIHVWPAGPHVIGDMFIYFLVGLCSPFLTAGVSDLHPLPQGSFLSAHDSPLWHRGSEGGRAGSQKLPTPHPPGLPNPTLPFTSLKRDVFTFMFTDISHSHI